MRSRLVYGARICVGLGHIKESSGRRLRQTFARLRPGKWLNYHTGMVRTVEAQASRGARHLKTISFVAAMLEKSGVRESCVRSLDSPPCIYIFCDKLCSLEGVVSCSRTHRLN